MSDSQGAKPPLHVLIDTNVALDMLLRREPWLSEAHELLDAHAEGKVIGYIPASTVTDIFYISRRLVGALKALEAVDLCLQAFELISVDRAVIDAARQLEGADFEDNVQIACAAGANLDFIVTRDVAGFAHAPMPALSPKDFAGHVR
jgi:predicted nucleic acid-binding protein